MKPTIQQAKKALKDFSSIMQKLKIPFCLDGGTLLGFYRQGTFCEDDQDDIDLTTFVQSKTETVYNILEESSKLGFSVYHVWLKKKNTTAQLSVQRDGVKIDLMFKEFKNNKAWWCVYRGENPETYKSVDKSFFEKLSALPVDDVAMFIPSETEAYLTERYGDWATPVHRRNYSCYKNDKSITTYEKI